MLGDSPFAYPALGGCRAFGDAGETAELFVLPRLVPAELAREQMHDVWCAFARRVDVEEQRPGASRQHVVDGASHLVARCVRYFCRDIRQARMQLLR